MLESKSGKPSGKRSNAADGPTPAGRTRPSKRAEHARKQGPARACTPESARPDQHRTKPAPLCEPASRAKPEPPETLNQKGAIALAKQLELYWRNQGYPAARFWAEPLGERFEKIGTYEIYRVTSNLVNGLPPRYRDP